MTEAARSSQPEANIRLRLQEMPNPVRVLTLAALATQRSGLSEFTTKELVDVEVELRLPPVTNLSATLARLRQQGLLVRVQASGWALTPKGEDRLTAEALHEVPASLAASLEAAPGSIFGAQRHGLVPPLLAPAGGGGLRKILDSSPFDSNVMLITQFPKGLEDHYKDLIPLLRAAVADHGLNLLVASDRIAEDTLWANVVTHMWASRYAIVLMDRTSGELNSNVLIEIGGMLMTGRRCAILRDESVPLLPSDLVGHIYKPVRLSVHAEVLKTVHAFLRDDIGTAECPNCGD